MIRPLDLGARLTCLTLAFVLAACSGPREDTTAEGTQGGHAEARFEYESPDPVKPVAPTRPVGEKPNVLLITLDTARRDRFSAYGYEKPTTPNVDELAREGMLFEDCMASSPVTLPSHTTILTGLEPYQHGVRNNGTFTLDEHFTTVAERLGEEGYATGAVVAAFPVIRRFGLYQGFETYDDTLTTAVPGTPVPQRLAEQVTPRGISWIREHAAEPWFLWIHYFDPHDPYLPPSPWAEEFPESPYDGEMAYMDAHLGGLFRELKRMGQWDSTFIVLVADHGEGLGDHYESTHSLFIYNTTIEVPLILKLPRSPAWEAPAFWERRVEGLVATTDIVPTILDVVGADGGSALPGSSVIPLVRDGQSVRETAYLETLVPELDYGWSPYFGLRTASWKLISGPNPELYEVARDPDELRNLYEKERSQAESMEQTLLEMTRDSRLAATISMSQETVEALRSLGYAGGGGVRASGELKDTKEMLWALEAFDDARLSMQQGDMQQVIDILQNVLSRDEANRFAMRMLSYALVVSKYEERGARVCRRILDNEPEAADRAVVRLRYADALVGAGRTEEALREAESLLSEDPPVVEARLVQARALAARGDMEDAVGILRDMEITVPQSPDPVKTLARIYEDQGRREDAERAYSQGIRTFPRDPDLLAGLGGIKVEQNNPEEAIGLLKDALTLDPTNARANLYMGLFQVRAQKPEEAMLSFQRAVKKEPGNARYHSTLASHCYAGRHYDQAVAHFTAAIELGSNEQNTFAGLGMTYARLNRSREAREMLEKALDMNPQSAQAEQIRRALASLAQ